MPKFLTNLVINDESPLTAMDYRREVDGLRALAVLPVIFFHAGFHAFSGGFVGVDVFFVISGYLITSIIINNLAEGTFSLTSFYERRARRILPALIFMVIVVFLFAWFWLIPRDMKYFAKSIVAVATFTSNFNFNLESGYFDTSAELKPLLHTWSLAVEEQFYLLFPLFLIIAWKQGERFIIFTLCLLFLLSLCLTQWGIYYDPSATFYLLPTRGWELLLGSFVAFYFDRISQNTTLKLSNLLSIIGIILVVFSILSFNKHTLFPSLIALLPTIGTALILLFAIKGTLTQRLLESKILVGIGLISYSAYLWHWPILALTKYRLLGEMSQTTLILLIIAVFPIAYISWRFVEHPFRVKGIFNRKAIFSLSFVVLLCAVILGFIGKLNGFDHRLTADGKSFSNVGLSGDKDYADIGLVGHCEGIPAINDCRTSDKPKILVWGDSFAKHSVYFAHEVLKGEIQQLTLADCAPLIGGMERLAFKRTKKDIDTCESFNQYVFSWLKNNPDIDTVILGSRYSIFERLQDNEAEGYNSSSLSVELISRIKSLQSMLKDRGGRVLIFPPPPTTGHDIGL